MRALKAGDVIDGFRLETPLNPGGMANIWRVSRDDAAFPLMIKVPFVHGGASPVAVVSFEAESMILPRLSGAHVPRFVKAGDISNPYIAMEFIEGTPLEARLDDTPLPAAEVAAIGAEIALALHDLHRQNVIHLDLKPSNVIIRPTGEAVLIDFGLARHDQLPDLPAEEIAGPIGTGPYIAPEQLRGDRSDPRSDIFALGVILYFLATGERPFGNPQAMREWKRRLWRDPVPPRAWNKDVPPWLQEIILRCLSVDPGQRPATAAELAFALRNPECVLLSSRATRTKRDGMLKVAVRWLDARKPVLPPPAKRSVAAQLARAPIIMAAVDLAPGHEPLAAAIAASVNRLFATTPGARIVCVSVLAGSFFELDPSQDEQGNNLHLRRLVELKHWARALTAPADRITVHALQSSSAANALLDFARTNRVDHIVIGARASSALRRYLGSVSSEVVAEASCTVTVVRTPASATA